MRGRPVQKEHEIKKKKKGWVSYLCTLFNIVYKTCSTQNRCKQSSKK